MVLDEDAKPIQRESVGTPSTEPSVGRYQDFTRENVIVVQIHGSDISIERAP